MPICHFIKADVEGMELAVLKGAQRIIRDCKPCLYLENNPGPDQDSLIRYVQGLGYDVWWHRAPHFNPNNVNGAKAEGDHEMAVASFNLLCLRSSPDNPIEGLEFGGGGGVGGGGGGGGGGGVWGWGSGGGVRGCGRGGDRRCRGGDRWCRGGSRGAGGAVRGRGCKSECTQKRRFACSQSCVTAGACNLWLDKETPTRHGPPHLKTRPLPPAGQSRRW
jgi:hypothetical protein